MKFLCLAFGDEDGWRSLSRDDRQCVLAQDAVIQERGATVSAVHPDVVSVRNQDGKLEVNNRPHHRGLPLAGFYLLEAENVVEVVDLVANTPCARARGVIEIHSVSPQDEGDDG